MSIQTISKKEKDKILSRLQRMDNDIKLLYLLRNFGPQRFTDLEKHSGLSKSTVSKYLKVHLKQNNLEKKIIKQRDVQEQRYSITKKGIEILNERFYNQDNELFFINEVRNQLTKLSELIEFYKEIGVDNSIIFQILHIVSKIGEDFFLLEQNRELYLTLFYVINYNSILTPDYKISKKQFCEVYGTKELYIDYYLDKIMSANLGFYMFVRARDYFFFHEEDLLGTITLSLIKDRLIEEIVYLYLIGPRKIYDLDKMAGGIAEKLRNMDLIWFEIQEQFEMLIEKLIIRTAIDMGFSKELLTDIVIQSEKLSKSKEGINSLINIIEGSKRYEDLNIVSIAETKEIKLDEVLGPLQGFCPNCGKVILEQDLSNKCSKCDQEFKPEDLLKSIDDAKEVSKRFKQEKILEEKLIKCANPECEANVLSNWEKCPVCSTPIKKLIRG